MIRRASNGIGGPTWLRRWRIAANATRLAISALRSIIEESLPELRWQAGAPPISLPIRPPALAAGPMKTLPSIFRSDMHRVTALHQERWVKPSITPSARWRRLISRRWLRSYGVFHPLRHLIFP